ncbi:MAG TPA: HAD-IB family hydrolase [Nocardioidaceae bacterium]|nr:HAD-IB family hydrolase [Nocardioidaceae bacterium]
MTIEEQLAEVRASDTGAKVAAFFDFDGTLIDGYSAKALYAHRLKNLEIPLGEIVEIARVARGGTPTEDEFGALLRRGIVGWSGRPVTELDELGINLFRGGLGASLWHDMWRLVKAHQLQGHTVVIATSATRFQVGPFARELGVEHVVCTELEEYDGLLTGRVVGRPPWGEGKAAAVRDLASTQGLDLAASYAYANGDEDIPFLSIVGNPCVVNPQPELAHHAFKKDWPELVLQRAPGQLDPKPLLRTTAMYGSLIGAGLGGVALGVLTGKRRRGIDFATSVFSHLAGAVGDVEVEIVAGEEHLWSHRPAVFLVNHQSSLIDFLVTTTVLRSGFTAVTKREVSEIPVIGQLLTLADFAFIDRADGDQARDVLRDAKDKLLAGTSVVISPEGTRSYSPQVGRFKKGAFHLAHQAGVPIIPIVIRNAGELMWRNSKVARPGSVEVVVHEPIPTAGWTKQDLDAAVVQVQELYESTLTRWPTTTQETQGAEQP